MKKTIYVAVLLGLATAPIRAQTYGNQGVTRAGDALQVLLPLAAYASTVYMDDWEGAKQYSKALVLNSVAVELLKKSTREWRPDHSSQLSFPSGHAAAALSAGAFVRQRYGFAYALPLYALGAYTGYSRVQAKKHYWHDVAGSLIVAELSQRIFTTRYTNTVVSLALSGAQGAQLSLIKTW
jgi:membrane-associated phospholipid phosphatase